MERWYRSCNGTFEPRHSLVGKYRPTQARIFEEGFQISHSVFLRILSDKVHPIHCDIHIQFYNDDIIANNPGKNRSAWGPLLRCRWCWLRSSAHPLTTGLAATPEPAGVTRGAPYPWAECPDITTISVLRLDNTATLLHNSFIVLLNINLSSFIVLLRSFILLPHSFIVPSPSSEISHNLVPQWSRETGQ